MYIHIYIQYIYICVYIYTHTLCIIYNSKSWNFFHQLPHQFEMASVPGLTVPPSRVPGDTRRDVNSRRFNREPNIYIYMYIYTHRYMYIYICIYGVFERFSYFLFSGVELFFCSTQNTIVLGFTLASLDVASQMASRRFCALIINQGAMFFRGHSS